MHACMTQSDDARLLPGLPLLVAHLDEQLEHLDPHIPGPVLPPEEEPLLLALVVLVVHDEDLRSRRVGLDAQDLQEVDVRLPLDAGALVERVLLLVDAQEVPHGVRWSPHAEVDRLLLAPLEEHLYGAAAALGEQLLVGERAGGAAVARVLGGLVLMLLHLLDLAELLGHHHSVLATEVHAGEQPLLCLAPDVQHHRDLDLGVQHALALLLHRQKLLGDLLLRPQDVLYGIEFQPSEHLPAPHAQQLHVHGRGALLHQDGEWLLEVALAALVRLHGVQACGDPHQRRELAVVRGHRGFVHHQQHLKVIKLVRPGGSHAPLDAAAIAHPHPHAPVHAAHGADGQCGAEDADQEALPGQAGAQASQDKADHGGGRTHAVNGATRGPSATAGGSC
mmetsp:Transcript_50138/g.154937  ORF Transcript_50138/g.154937 Transcript_50138/m.154937 type:complete len:392 (-) Transcript_50138:8-1183(-)